MVRFPLRISRKGGATRMEGFKFTAWNIEHADKLLDLVADSDDDKRRKATARRDAIAAEISALDADILLVSEGPNGEERATEFFDQVAPDYRLIVRGSDDRDDYGMRGTDAVTGRQWLWFLIRKTAPIDGQLLHLDRWRHHTEASSRGEHKGGRWDVSYPELKIDDDGADRFEYSIEKNHGHWRHPQVLQATIDGHFFEIIGCHLKSKITRVRPKGDVMGESFFTENRELVADLIKSRVKITTECADIRHYIDHRFAEDASAPIIVAGDLNDGPGKERIERRFLYHDLIGTLQGEVFFARRFLNHALFDFAEEERWSVFFRDRLDPERSPRILLDHILFSQSFTGNSQVEPFGFRAMAGGGLVEHEVHHAINGTRPKYAETSDHKPVSMNFGRRKCGSTDPSA